MIDMLQTLVFEDYLLILASLIGIVLFLYSTTKILNIINLLPKESKTRSYWMYALILTIVFSLGYLMSIVAVLVDQKQLLDSITPFIYLFGALFVFIVVLVSFRTYKAILESAE